MVRQVAWWLDRAIGWHFGGRQGKARQHLANKRLVLERGLGATPLWSKALLLLLVVSWTSCVAPEPDGLWAEFK